MYVKHLNTMQQLNQSLFLESIKCQNFSFTVGLVGGAAEEPLLSSDVKDVRLPESAGTCDSGL